MPAQHHAAHQQGHKGGGAPAAGISFMQGTYEYSEIMDSTAFTLGTTTQDKSIQITPGGFLRGVSLYVTSTTGALGSGTANADNPFNVFSSMTLESIDGTPIKYPMGGYSYYLEARFCRPWDGDPARDYAYNSGDTPPTGYAAGANPAFRMRFFTESRGTAGVLPNTDARAQYRFRYTVNTLANVIFGGTPTAPVVTVVTALETYAQPPVATLSGQHIQQVPDGVALQRFTSHQVDVTTTADQTVKENRVGNLIRTLLLVFRDNTAASSGGPLRVDLTSDPIRWRVDNTQLLVENRTRRSFEAARFYSTWGPQATANTIPRPVGVYPYFRWHRPGELEGQFWLETTEATFLQFEFIGAASAGTLETITEDIAPAGHVPAYLNGV